MGILIAIFFTLLFIITPYFLKGLGEQTKLSNILSDVVVCFLVGIFLGNTKQWWMPDLGFQATATTVAKVSSAAPVLLAIPMLLMTSDIRASMRYAPKFLISFVLCIIAVLLATLMVVYYFPDLENLGIAAGCLVGVYIGGTPNMVAISYAVDAPEELFGILNSTDLMSSGLYFVFLTSVAKAFFGLFLPAVVPSEATSDHLEHQQAVDETKFPPKPLNKETLSPLFVALFLAMVCIAISLFFGWLFPNPNGELNEMLLMIVLTTVSILFSFHPKIQSLKGVYELAQYLLLIFAIAVGFMADFSKLASEGSTYVLFNVILVILLILFHFLLAMLFRIDTDTFIITSTACVFGPPFIGQVCSALKNKEMLAPGMALGVLGLVIGTYLGILVASLIG